MTPYQRAVVNLAEDQLGNHEVPLGSNRGPEVDRYIRASGLDPARGSYPWCMAFAYWVHASAATEIGGKTTCPRTAGVARAWHKLVSRGLPHWTAAQIRAGEVVLEPGDVFFRATTPKDAALVLRGHTRPGHCGIVWRTAPEVEIQTIEGNTNDLGSREGHRVAQRTLAITDPRLVGVARFGLAE